MHLFFVHFGILLICLSLREQRVAHLPLAVCMLRAHLRNINVKIRAPPINIMELSVLMLLGGFVARRSCDLMLDEIVAYLVPPTD